MDFRLGFLVIDGIWQQNEPFLRGLWDMSDKIEEKSTRWEAQERRAKGKYIIKRRRSRRIKYTRQWQKIKEIAKSLSIAGGICFFVAILIAVITGSLPGFIQGIVTKNIEKVIKNTTASFTGGRLTPKDFKALVKNIDINKLKDKSMKNMSGWVGDRGEIQTPDERKQQIEHTYGGGSVWSNDSPNK